MTKPRRLERGEFRAIKRALLDGPDFQRLSSAARHVLLTLKISAGPAGIEVEYEGSTASRLAEQTGIGLAVVREALTELSKLNWYRREGGVHWILGHLQHEPSISATNENHRVSIQNHVGGLPHTSVVRDFILSHRQWFPTNEATAGGYAWAAENDDSADSASHRPSHTPSVADGIGDHRILRTEDGQPSTDDESARQPSAVEQLLAVVPNRNAWEAEIATMREGTPGHRSASQTEIEQAAAEYLANNDVTRKSPNVRAFRGYVKRVQRAPDGVPDLPVATSNKVRSPRLAEAQRLTAEILSLTEENLVAGQGTKRVIRNALVEEHFGPQVYAAFRAVGGSARFLETEAAKYGLLHRDFAAALDAPEKAR